MRKRQTRPNVFRGLRRFGVHSTDWKFILVPTGAAYLLPFIFGIWVGYVPLGFPLGLLTFLVLIGAFNFLRRSKPECWLTHKMEAVSEKWADVRAPLISELEARDWVQK